jgi:rSAM/selenodomain-associated transferase 1
VGAAAGHILPARDEEATVGGVVRALRGHPAFRAWPAADSLPAARIVVVDNGSDDATARVAAEAGAEVVCEPQPGYGAACLAGVLAAADCKVILLMDADGSDDLDGAALVARAVLTGEADLAMGSRTRGTVERGALAPQQRFGNALAATLLRYVYGLRVSDLGPTRAIRRAHLLRLEMRELGYGWSAEMLAKAARAGLRVREIPVDYHRRAGGRSKVAGTLRGTLRAGVHILRTLARNIRWQPDPSPLMEEWVPRHGDATRGDDGRGMGRASQGGPTPGPTKPLQIGGSGGEPRRGSARARDLGVSSTPSSPTRDMGGSVLAIVARLPVAGQVKTRLGTVIGHTAATALYAAFLQDLGARFTGAATRDGYDLCWLYSLPDGAAEEDFARCVLPGSLLLAQEGGDLAARLWNGTQALASLGYVRVVVVGSDSPHLPAARICQAFEALATSQIALGPADDGGYYLLGQRAVPAPVDLFSGIRMSTPSVCAETLERAGALCLDVALLPSSFDVDEVADLARLRTVLAAMPSSEADPCPATLAILRALDDPARAMTGVWAPAGDER